MGSNIFDELHECGWEPNEIRLDEWRNPATGSIMAYLSAKGNRAEIPKLRS